MGLGINDACGIKVGQKTMEVFPSDHGQQEVINNLLDVQKDTVEPKLDSLSDKDDLEALQDREGQEKGEILGMGPR